MTRGTTTCIKRNLGSIQRTKQIAKDIGLENPTLIEYGPGGIVNFLFKALPEESKEKQSKWNKVKRDTIRHLDTILRRTNCFALKSSEPYEIAYEFRDLNPSMLYVVDKEKKVIDAVKRIFESDILAMQKKYAMLDIQYEAFKHQGDIVFAYNIVERTVNPEKAFNNIAQTTKQGGLLATTMLTIPPGFEKKENGIYQRVN